MDEREIIIQDIDVALKAIEDKDSLYVNIIGNRILSNIMFLEDKSPFLTGLFLKEISFFMTRSMAIYDEEEIISTSKKAVESFRELIKNGVIKYKEYWDIYYQFEMENRHYLLRETEIKAYTDNLEFTNLMIEGLINLIRNDKEYIYKEKNLFLNGILNELSRTLNNHGGEMRAYQIYIFFKMLNNQFNYIRYEALHISGEFDSKIIEMKLTPFIDRFIQIYGDNPEEEIFIQNISDLILNLVIEWRKHYIFYMDINVRSVQTERKIELPIESRKKIGEVITKALEEEMKK